jgi:Fic family protein
MDTKAFTNPSGKLVKNREGNLTFVPDPLPPKLNYDEEFVPILSEADSGIGKLAGIGQLLPNPHLLIRPYIRREAVLSSRIEGTQASLSDLFLYEAMKKEPEEFLRLREVGNYVTTTERCLRLLEKGEKISLELIKYAHKLLLRKVRGADRTPGKFRNIQNWIGPPGCLIEDATFVPPPVQKLHKVLPAFEKFIQNPPSELPLLVQTALIHYQFEAIHPFVDGNGRIGRLLIALFFCERKVLPQPLLYLSAFFDRNKQEYYDKLLKTSQDSDWIGWIKFFLRGISIQAKEATENAQQIINLQRKYHERLLKKKAKVSATRLADKMFLNPYTTISDAAKYLGVSFPTAKAAIGMLEKADILEEFTGKSRNRIYVAKELLRILE